MGKREDRQNTRQINHRTGFTWQKGAGYLAALVASCLTACAIGKPTPTPCKQDDDKTFNQDLAWRSLLKQCKFGPRKPGTSAHIQCRDYIVDELKKSCDDVRLQPFSHVWSVSKENIKMWNVIGDQNWKNAKTRVVLLAHWDSRPEADQDRDLANRDKPILGADDGASGVAVLIELARAMKNNLPPGLGIEYFLTDGEDLGPGEDEMYLGVLEYAKSIPKANYGILLDMIGQKNLSVPMEGNSLQLYPRLMNDLYNHAAKVGVGDAFPKKPGEYIDDDHLPLIKAGLPTVDLIEFEGYAPYWHTLQDTEDKCSAESLGKVGKLLQTWLMQNPPYTFTPG